ncbi:MAG: PQQ-binding-like beta-propeller repeat protein [Candidatus Woesearchaeota archaeon]
MSSLRRVKIGYCNARVNEKPSYGPIILADDGEPMALVGTMNGGLVTIPLIFGSSKDYRDEYEVLSLTAGNTINLKEIFLDQEVSSSVIGIENHKNTIIVSLLDGKIFNVGPKGNKLVVEFESTLSAPPTLIGIGPQSFLLVPTTEGVLYLMDVNGKIISKIANTGKISSKPSFIVDNNSVLIGNSEGIVTCYDIGNKGVFAKKWQFKANKAITTEIIHSDLMSDGRIFYLFGSADKSIYCITDEGIVAWSFPTEGKIISGVFIDDINNDGVKEVVFGSCDDKVYVLSAYGTEIWNYETDFWVAATPSVIDVDEDNYKEVFVGSYDNSLYCFSPEADFIPHFFSGASGIVQQSSSFEHGYTDASAGYFARKLFQEQLDGMIIGIYAHEKKKILAALTNKGEFRSYQFEQL